MSWIYLSKLHLKQTRRRFCRKRQKTPGGCDMWLGRIWKVLAFWMFFLSMLSITVYHRFLGQSINEWLPSNWLLLVVPAAFCISNELACPFLTRDSALSVYGVSLHPDSRGDFSPPSSTTHHFFFTPSQGRKRRAETDWETFRFLPHFFFFLPFI